ncbi:uncharacterized protein LOC132558238 [Ylistrum balloti]|uniref:uncharacterized protein LOC132558238 n=1 Tax=Ylistrum balloti TaxID=509963 RepID=UPI00290587B6|nr:uncharacterized protein LOC132558238 [Ylistrum balloti]
MSNQLRAAELLRQAASALMNTAPETPSSERRTNVTPQTNSGACEMSVQAAVRNVFSPYNRGSSVMRGAKRRGQTGTGVLAVSYWTHRYCILQSTCQETVPTREEKHKLYKLGFGEKKITFQKNDDPLLFKQRIEESFPALEKCGEYELLQSTVGSRVFLEKLQIPKNGYNANFFANESNLGQAVCYIRPIQKDLELVKHDFNDKGIDGTSETVYEECMECKTAIPLSQLRDHIKMCSQSISSEVSLAGK